MTPQSLTKPCLNNTQTLQIKQQTLFRGKTNSANSSSTCQVSTAQMHLHCCACIGAALMPDGELKTWSADA